jgi:hypothetical protein
METLSSEPRIYMIGIIYSINASSNQIKQTRKNLGWSNMQNNRRGHRGDELEQKFVWGHYEIV